MIKIKKSVIAAFIGIASMSLTACGKRGEVVFWSSFGEKYTKKLDAIVADMSKELGISIEHVSKGSYPKIRKEVIDSIANSNYPGLAVGYPDHFAQYHGSDILVKLDTYVDDEMLKDYDPNYMPENYLYDRDGTQHLYGVPFNKSTELLGYNGVFVDYCAWKYDDETLKVLPETWDEWKVAKTNPETKAGKYYSAFKDLIRNKRIVYASQYDDGTAYDFHYDAPVGEQVKVFDYTEVEESVTKLMTWDSTDNAFITLVRQFDGQYTRLPEDQHSVALKRRQGEILFANTANLPKTINMLKTFNQMYKDDIFGTPGDIGGNYSSEAFSRGCVMFMVCSSGGLSYNTDNWSNRFRVTQIPYTDEQHKYVISQGANICMTKNGNQDKSFKVMKALTTGKFQTRWAIETGYFPASNTSADSEEYQNFLKDTSYENKTLVAYREGAQINENKYRKGGWNRFVDDAFIGSAIVREQVGYILPNVLKNVTNVNDDNAYKAELRNVLNGEQIKNNINIKVDSAL